MEIATGDFGGYRIALQSVTSAAHSALTRMNEADKQAIRGILTDAIERMIGTDRLECTEDPSDERKRLLHMLEPIPVPCFRTADAAPPMTDNEAIALQERDAERPE